MIRGNSTLYVVFAAVCLVGFVTVLVSIEYLRHVAYWNQKNSKDDVDQLEKDLLAEPSEQSPDAEQDDPSGCRPVLPDQCGSKWQKAYCKFHQSALKSNNASTNFLIFTCHGGVCGGLGNRMQGLLSVFYLAMLLNRTFLIDWGPPGRLINHLEPNQINWSVPLTDIGIFESREYWGCCMYDPAGYSGFRAEKKETFHEWTLENHFENYFQERLAAVGTIWHFAEFLVKNPVFKDRARDLDLPRTYSTLYGCAFHYIFQQSTRMKAALEDARKFLSRQSPLLGLHVRTNDYHFGYGSLESFRSRNTSSFFVCAVRLSKIIRDNIKPPPPNLKWFLAVDNKAVKNMAREKYPNDIVTLNFRPKHFGYADDSIGDTIISEVLSDLFLLAESDYLLITPRSSLSRVIASVGLHNEGSAINGEICVANKTTLITAVSRLTSPIRSLTSK